MDTQLNCMLVLQPCLSAEQRAAFLLAVYSWLGHGYDSCFELAGASQQVCTEVIYSVINGKGEIDFSLTVRASHETLGAADIANDPLDVNAEAFNFVMLVATDADSNKNGALVYTGVEGEDKPKALMAEAKNQLWYDR